MNLQEIITKADNKYPNSKITSEKIAMCNELERRLYRKFKIVDSASYEILADVDAYPLGIKESVIVDILVNGDSVPKKKITSTSSGSSRYWAYIQDAVVLYPMPTEDGTLTAYFYEPAVSMNSVSDTPSLDDAYHMIFVWYLCKDAAEDDRQYDVASGFIQQYNDIEAEMRKHFPAPEVELIRNNSGW